MNICFFKDVKNENSFLKDLYSFYKEVNMQELYIFRYEMEIFILLVGETIIRSGWHIDISQMFHKVINQLLLIDTLKNRVDRLDLLLNFLDHTYSDRSKL